MMFDNLPDKERIHRLEHEYRHCNELRDLLMSNAMMAADPASLDPMNPSGVKDLAEKARLTIRTVLRKIESHKKSGVAG